MTLSFQYEPLAAREFRVFSFVHSPSLDYDIAIKLEILSVNPEKTLSSYNAISYACGDVQDKVSILVNGADLRIYRSLHRVLQELRDAQSSTQYWADAICINQHDLKEKSFQVSIIGLLYTGAALVQVFLGRDSIPLTLTAEKMTSLIKKLSDPAPPGVVTKEYLDSHGIPDQDYQTWADLRAFFSRPWFRRLWVMQEAALGRQVVFCWNRQTISLELLITLTTRVKRMDMEFLLATPEDSELTTWQTVNLIELLRERSSENNLARALYLTRSKQCSEPVDRVFAWRWMLPKSTQEQITFRYDIYTQVPYWQSFIELSYIALNEFPGLTTLPLACTEKRIPGLPSWCSNLESEFDCFAFAREAFKAGGPKLVDAVGPHIATSRNGRSITLNGFKVTEVKSAVRARYLHKFSKHHVKSNAVSASRYLSECITFCDTLDGGDVAKHRLLRTLVVDEIYTYEGARATDEELRLYFLSYCQYLDACQKGEPGATLDFEDLEAKRIAQMDHEFPYANTGRKIFITTCGKYGNAYHSVEAGDLVCVFRGTVAPLVLRRREESGRYTFVGDAWITGLMEGEALGLGLTEEDFVVE